MIKTLSRALKNVFATIGVGSVAIVGYAVMPLGVVQLAKLENAVYPVLAPVTICKGGVDGDTGECLGKLVTYESFKQTGKRCEGDDAIVSGVMSKARDDAEYIEGRQLFRFGKPDGRSRRAFFEFLDQPNSGETNRDMGVQDWGPWLLRGGCSTQYRTWYTTVEHKVWHGQWNLKTTMGPFPLPRPAAY